MAVFKPAEEMVPKSYSEGMGVNRLREVEPGNWRDLETISQLHMELLSSGPMAGLGEAFIRELCYAAPLRDGVLRVALYEVEGRPAGFVAYTPRSITLHRTLLRNHWTSAVRVLMVSMLRDPRRLLRLPRAVRVVFSRRGEQDQNEDPLAEIVSLCVRPEYLTPEFVRGTGLRIGDELVSHAASHFARAGLRTIRMIVDADNKQALLFYHRLGGRFESSEQGGEPRTIVWLDLHSNAAARGDAIPECWSEESISIAAENEVESHWTCYWDGLREDQSIFRMESRDLVKKLEKIVRLDQRMRVLDFGCGFGFVAEMLASKAGEVYLWDSSPNMRRQARVNVAGRPNVRFLDLSKPATLPRHLRFDLILVNSVLQYLTPAEISYWLSQLRGLLTPEGCLLLSDLIPSNHRPAQEIVDYFRFALRHGFFWHALAAALREWGRYNGTRRRQPLSTVSEEDLSRWASGAGMALTLLPTNLTYRRQRIAAALHPENGMNCRVLRKGAKEPIAAGTNSVDDQYTEVNYRQFQGSRCLRLARSIAGVLTWPVVWPLAMVCRTSNILFRSASEMLSLIPYLFGVVVRGEFYRFALRRCGRNVIIEFGTIFVYRDISIGDHVLIGRYNTIHHCDFGSYVLTAEHCVFLSGSKYHNYDRTDIPMALQGGKLKRIRIADDCWIGARSVVMENMGRGSVVGAGAVVTKPVPELTIVVGNPAQPVRRRGERQTGTIRNLVDRSGYELGTFLFWLGSISVGG